MTDDEAVKNGEAVKNEIFVIQDYHSAAHVITEPDKYVACSRYFVRRWMPLLGNEGTRIVLALRSLGYFNPGTGETRNGIEIELAELAAMIGVHVATLKREFGDVKGKPGSPANPALQKFVRKEKQYWRDPVTNRLLRTANIYRVMMDDPLHEDDLPRLNEILVSREKGAQPSKAQNAPQMPKSRRKNLSEAQNALHVAQNAPSRAQNAPNKVQNAPPLKDYSALPLNTSDTATLPGVSASLFGDQSNTEGSASAKNSLSLLAQAKLAGKAWATLLEADRPPWLEQAKRELIALHAGTGITVKLKLIEARAANLYEMSLRGQEPKPSND